MLFLHKNTERYLIKYIKATTYDFFFVCEGLKGPW